MSAPYNINIGLTNRIISCFFSQLQIKTTLIAIRVLFVIGTITAVAFGVSVDLYVLGWVCVALNISTYAAPIITTVRKILKTT